jgi:hypothetical protein
MEKSSGTGASYLRPYSVIKPTSGLCTLKDWLAANSDWSDIPVKSLLNFFRTIPSLSDMDEPTMLSLLIGSDGVVHPSANPKVT